MYIPPAFPPSFFHSLAEGLGRYTFTPPRREASPLSPVHYYSAVYIEFDPEQITYEDLLDVFFSTHDPTTLNRQGADQGTQYRSIILYVNDDQKQRAEDFVVKLDESRTLGNPVVTEIVPLEVFYEAEPEHRQFYMENPDSMYCQIVIRPKVAKVREKFAQKISSKN